MPVSEMDTFSPPTESETAILNLFYAKVSCKMMDQYFDEQLKGRDTPGAVHYFDEGEWDEKEKS